MSRITIGKPYLTLPYLTLPYLTLPYLNLERKKELLITVQVIHGVVMPRI